MLSHIDAKGQAHHLRGEDFALAPAQETWTSQVTQAVYPTRWKIVVPSLGLNAQASTPLAAQEISSNSKLAPSYWEGAIFLEGAKKSRLLRGSGYLEMTGYDRPVRMP